jgi:hypothetical protein
MLKKLLISLSLLLAASGAFAMTFTLYFFNDRPPLVVHTGKK